MEKVNAVVLQLVLSDSVALVSTSSWSHIGVAYCAEVGVDLLWTMT